MHQQTTSRHDSSVVSGEPTPPSLLAARGLKLILSRLYRIAIPRYTHRLYRLSRRMSRGRSELASSVMWPALGECWLRSKRGSHTDENHRFSNHVTPSSHTDDGWPDAHRNDCSEFTAGDVSRPSESSSGSSHGRSCCRRGCQSVSGGGWLSGSATAGEVPVP